MSFRINKNLITKALQFYAEHNTDPDLGSKMWTAHIIEDELKKLEAHVTPHELLNKHGGAWLGFMHDRIKWDASNGESVTWGSHDVLNMRMQMTPAYFEDLAANIAAAAINEALGRRT